MTLPTQTAIVAESTAYDNLLTDVENYEKGFQPPKPEKSPDFPFTLMVHIWREGEAQKFARTIGKRLSSDRKKFVYRDGVQVKQENAIYVEKRSDPYKKNKRHLTREEAKHWKNTLEFSQTAFVPYDLRPVSSSVLR